MRGKLAGRPEEKSVIILRRAVAGDQTAKAQKPKPKKGPKEVKGTDEDGQRARGRQISSTDF